MTESEFINQLHVPQRQTYWKLKEQATTELTDERDTLLAHKISLTAERDALRARVADLEKCQSCGASLCRDCNKCYHEGTPCQP